MGAARLLLHVGALTGALLGLAPGAFAGQLSGTLVVFAPRVEARFKEDYGVDEEGALREAIVSALSRALAPVTLPRPLGARISVENVLPTRPTRAQTDANPGMSDLRSKYRGGAALTAELRDAQGNLVSTVRYDYFAPTVPAGSPAHDPWADARLAIDGLAARLAAACAAPPHAPAPPTAAAAPR
ncbi:MAG TPA: hypothetical protein VH109_08110 [Steroidobacteraceae bacterium]|jgi:hypothetical protein|nr:hypothetical protein [Steroidobacteraceae bacterium]